MQQTVDKVVDISAIAQRLIPMVLVFLKTTEVHQLQYIEIEVDVAVVQVVQVLAVPEVRAASRGAVLGQGFYSSSTRSLTSLSSCRG